MKTTFTKAKALTDTENVLVPAPNHYKSLTITNTYASPELTQLAKCIPNDPNNTISRSLFIKIVNHIKNNYFLSILSFPCSQHTSLPFKNVQLDNNHLYIYMKITVKNTLLNWKPMWARTLDIWYYILTCRMTCNFIFVVTRYNWNLVYQSTKAVMKQEHNHMCSIGSHETCCCIAVCFKRQFAATSKFKFK